MVLLYIFVAHDNIEDVFSYMLIFAEYERDEDVWCRHSKGILWQGFQHSVVGSGLKFTELYTIIHVYMCNQNKN